MEKNNIPNNFVSKEWEEEAEAQKSLLGKRQANPWGDNQATKTKPPSKKKHPLSARDISLLKAHHRLIHSPQPQSSKSAESCPKNLDPSKEEDYAQILSLKYYNQLCKDYVLCRLSQGQELSVRWRSRAERERGKGETECGNLDCQNTENILPLEILFKYKDKGGDKKAMLKGRFCPRCALKVKGLKTK